MFGIGTAEILVILCIALVVLGPKELPKVARTVGRGIREIQRARDDLKKNIEFKDDPKPPRAGAGETAPRNP